MPLEVDGQEVPVGFGFTEQPDQRGFPDLPCAAQDQRLARSAVQPFLHVLQPMAVHGTPMVSFLAHKINARDCF